MIIAVDFDGTIVEHRYPLIGKEKPFAIETLKKLQQEGHYIILWTVREKEFLEEAVDYCHSKGLDFHAVNCNLGEDKTSQYHRKINADIFIDDRNLGELPDWGQIYQMITNKLSWKDITDNQKNRKKSFFQKFFNHNS